jgi:hypothetical protein
MSILVTALPDNLVVAQLLKKSTHTSQKGDIISEFTGPYLKPDVSNPRS